VVESGESGGSLITAEFATQQNRDVFAVPGNIFSLKSKGTNSLIKDGAALVRSAEDIVHEYEKEKPKVKFNEQPIQRRLVEKVGNLSTNVRIVYEAIVKSVNNIDSLSIQTGLPYVELSNAVFELELKGLIVVSPGGRYRPQY
jgi:DNA processing protein